MQFIYGSADNYEEQERLCMFVARRAEGVMVSPELSSGIAVVCDHGVGVVLYNNHIPGVDMHMHVAGEGQWLSRTALEEFFGYPFIRAGCRRVTAIIDAKNRRSRKFCERLGFKREGTVRKAMPNGNNAIVYGMLKNECRWIPKEEVDDGQELAITAASA